MRSKQTKTPDLLVLCGHGDYGEEADTRILEIAAASKASGEYPDYLIYGNETYARRRRKHNFLIGDAPVVAYTFVNTLLSQSERIVFVGNPDTKLIFDALMDHFQPEPGRFRYIPESPLGFAANVEAGKRALYGDEHPDRHTLLLNGDLPLLFNLAPPLNDPDLAENDLIFDANSLELQGAFLPRSYRVKLEYRAPGEKCGTIYRIKEPNYFLLRLDLLTPEIIDSVYGARRINDPESGSWKSLVRRTYVSRGRILRVFPIVAARFALHNFFTWLARVENEYIFGTEQAERLVAFGLRQVGLKARVKVKIQNRDPGAKKDIDSFGDWSYLNGMRLAAGDSFASIYPPAALVRDFARAMMPRLTKTVPVLADFPAYINEEFRRFGLLEPYSANGQFRGTMVAEQLIHDDLEYHSKYVESLPADEARRATANPTPAVD